jgi:hypothetical protein
MGGGHVKPRRVRSAALVVAAVATVTLLVAWADSYYRVVLAGSGWNRSPGDIGYIFARSEEGRLRLGVASASAATFGVPHAGPFFRHEARIPDQTPAPAPPVYVNLAAAELNKAQVTLKRLEKLYASEIAQGFSNSEVDLARADVAVAQAMLALRQYESQQRPAPAPAPAVSPPRFMPRWEQNGWEGLWIRLRNDRPPAGTKPPAGGTSGRWVEVPYWMPFLLAAAPLAFAARTARQRRLRFRRGLCVSCGYDLRGSGEQCPECGTPAAAAAAEKSPVAVRTPPP